ALSVLFLRPAPVDQAMKNRLQGAWTATAMNVGGMPIVPEMDLTFKDSQMTLLGLSGTYQIDAGKHPMQLDRTVQGAVSHWIFERNEDERTLAFMQPPGDQPLAEPPPPADFSPQPG